MDVRDGGEMAAEARRAVRSYLRDGAPPRQDPRFSEKHSGEAGVFVTITGRGGGLRGCIGYPGPAGPLCGALHRAAVSAATEDPRFPPVTLDELDGLAFEVTVLEPPRLVEAREPDDYLAMVRPGRDGVIIERGNDRGLLLPQVAAEHGWSARELLENACRKAGLPPDCWRRKGTRVLAFGGRRYTESV